MSQEKVNSGILLAFDRSTFNQNDANLVRDVSPFIAGVKIGKEAIAARVADDVHDCVRLRELLTMYDCKDIDIPNTMGNAMKNWATRGYWGVTVMADADVEGVRAAVENRGSSLIIGVTVLTSLTSERCKTKYGRIPTAQVSFFVDVLLEAGAHAIVCSPHELEIVRKCAGSRLLCITPGIRNTDAKPDDQKRTMTASDAIKAGADYLVIGRPIMTAENPVRAASDLRGEVEAVRANRSMI